MINPPFVMVATEGALLTHVPVESDDTEVVLSMHIGEDPVMFTIGLADTLPCNADDTHPLDVCVKVKVTGPADTPVTRPALFTLAISVSLDAHVPPVVGESVVVNPAHMTDGPVNETVGGVLTVTGAVLSETQPVVSVK